MVKKVEKGVINDIMNKLAQDSGEGQDATEIDLEVKRLDLNKPIVQL